MMSYPSISNVVRTDVSVYVWDKIDGSNIRAEWNKKKGFYKFGSRNQLIDESSKQFGESIKLIKETYADDLNAVFCEERLKNAIAFFEFFGKNSFAGNHVFDEQHEVTLLDVSPNRIGMLDGASFYDMFYRLKLPKLLYVGRITCDFVESVRAGTLDGMTFEGVVCKGSIDRKTGLPILFKIKSRSWLTKLKTFVNDDEAEFVRLM